MGVWEFFYDILNKNVDVYLIIVICGFVYLGL